MDDMFPDAVEVPRGLVTTRLIWGVQPWVFALLLMLGIAPLYLWGWGKWWVVPLALGMGRCIAGLARDDPDFLKAWRVNYG